MSLFTHAHTIMCTRVDTHTQHIPIQTHIHTSNGDVNTVFEIKFVNNCYNILIIPGENV